MIDIGKSIYSMLSAAGIKCYPIIAENGATNPFVVYKRTSFNPTTGKDCMIYNATATVEITVVASTYDESIATAESVISALNFKNNESIKDITLIDASEDNIDDCYLQILIFNIKI